MAMAAVTGKARVLAVAMNQGHPAYDAALKPAINPIFDHRSIRT
jgi:hypothetical protein